MKFFSLLFLALSPFLKNQTSIYASSSSSSAAVHSKRKGQASENDDPDDDNDDYPDDENHPLCTRCTRRADTNTQLYRCGLCELTFHLECHGTIIGAFFFFKKLNITYNHFYISSSSRL